MFPQSVIHCVVTANASALIEGAFMQAEMCKTIVSLRRKWILVGGDDLTITTETLLTADDDG